MAAQTPPAPAASFVTFTESDEPEGGEPDPSQEELTLGGPARAVRTRSLTSATVAYATASTTADKPDGYIDRLLKYIPSEIIALYLGVTNVVPVQDSSYWLSLWIITIVTALCTPIYMYIMTKEDGQPTAWEQIVISSIAFPIWVFAIGGPFVQYSWYAPKHWIAAVIITFSTFLIGIRKPAESQGAAPPQAAAGVALNQPGVIL
jgi:hypothetical protein